MGLTVRKAGALSFITVEVLARHRIGSSLAESIWCLLLRVVVGIKKIK